MAGDKDLSIEISMSCRICFDYRQRNQTACKFVKNKSGIKQCFQEVHTIPKFSEFYVGN